MISTSTKKNLNDIEFLSIEKAILLQEIILELKKLQILMDIAFDEGYDFPYKEVEHLQISTIDVLDILASFS